jgi:hypothetical protein
MEQCFTRVGKTLQRFASSHATPAGSLVTAVFNFTSASGFDPRQRRKDFSSSLCVQTGSGPHSASYTTGTGVSFPRG